MIKNPDSSRTQAIRSVLREVPKIIPLSGTPWKNNGSEFFVVLNLLDPVLFNSYKAFVNLDCDVYWEGNRRKIGGISDPEKFKKKIEHLAIRRERKFVLPELPQTNRVRTYCELDRAGTALYSEEETKVARILQDAVLEGTENSFQVKSLLQQSIMVMRQIIGLAKVDTIVEVADEFLQNCDRKLCIFLHHIQVANLVEAKLKSLGHNPLRLAGGISSEEKYQIQEKFRTSDRLLIASTLSAGEGLNLQECSDFIIGERQWNAANEEQAEDRFNRIGQKADQVNGIYILARETVDEDLDSIIERKRKQYETVMNKEGYQVKWSEDSVTKEVMTRLLDRYNKRKAS
jgi:SNF2 family DNA or RNA helicase